MTASRIGVESVHVDHFGRLIVILAFSMLPNLPNNNNVTRQICWADGENISNSSFDVALEQIVNSIDVAIFCLIEHRVSDGHEEPVDDRIVAKDDDDKLHALGLLRGGHHVWFAEEVDLKIRWIYKDNHFFSLSFY